ncbi:MAG: (d)CMP kinase, partial [Clostridiales bacterium]|nr:(d)CMP kinase [Clostridiales bacterium]
MPSARGAITAENTAESIWEQTTVLLSDIFERNKIKRESVSSIIFSCTKDLNTAYPAVAARNAGLTEAALFCVQEMDVKGSLAKCIRVLVNFEANIKQREVLHSYLGKAKILRPDFAEKLKIAIDGTIGSGKSTVAKLAASKLSLSYVDTGALYRAYALFVTKTGVNPEDETAVCALKEKLKISVENGRTFLNGDDVTDLLRSAEIGSAASKIAVYEEVRDALLDEQKFIAKKGGVVMDGRDIGTNIMPDADIKIYMDADAEVRAKRRVGELTSLGKDADFDKILAQIQER